MHPPDNPHDAAFDEQRREILVLVALGEPAEDWFEAHRRVCEQCQRDLSAYQDTVGLARASGNDRALPDDGPPASVWSGISHTLGFDDPASGTRGRGAPRASIGSAGWAGPADSVGPGRPGGSMGPRGSGGHHRSGSGQRRWQIGLIAAAAIVAIAGGVGIGVIVERDNAPRPVPTRIVSQAYLNRAPGGPTSVSGAAKVHTSARGLAISIDTTGLPLRQGYYQVWLYDPAEKRMVPVGALGDDGKGTFNVPAGIDLRTYDIIDVSAQDYDGSYEHKQTVLQGPLTQ